MAKINESESPSVNLIGTGTTIVGDIKSTGDIRIDGTLKGSIHSKGKVVVGSTGNVEGEITCRNSDISGTLKVKIIVSELLSLKPTAKLTGEITTNKLAIEPGASFSGTCSMGAVVKDIKTDTETSDFSEEGSGTGKTYNEENAETKQHAREKTA